MEADYSSSVVQIEWKTPMVFELIIDKKDIQFQPGDSISIFNAAESQSRSYSIASGTEESGIRFLIQKLPGGELSNWLASLQPGDKIAHSKPYGWFRPGQNINGEPFIFIATGTGIAPFLSYIRSFPEKPPAYCLYGVKKICDALEFELLQSRCEVKLAVSREDKHDYHCGRVTDFLPELKFNSDLHFYLCGLDAMIDEVSGILEKNGVDFAKIHREVFFYAPS